MYVVEHPLRDLVLREDPLKVLYLVYHRTAFPGGGGGRHIEGAGAHPCDAHEDPIRETAGRRQAMDMNYDILSYDELPADEAAMLKADAEEAERATPTSSYPRR